MSAIKLFI